MVNKIRKGDAIFFVCSECGFVYADKITAQSCEDWCRKYKSCNLEITKRAIR